MHTQCDHGVLLVTCFVFLCYFGWSKCETAAEISGHRWNSPHKVRMKVPDEERWQFEPIEGVRVQVDGLPSEETSVLISVQTKDDDIVERKMKMSMNNALPYLIVPGFLMAGILPWIMPGIKMVVTAVTMVNQMMFNAALFALVRSYVFDTEKSEHIVYINQGYKNKPVQHHGRR